ncbi:MAG TPA: DUF4062 domain-containing protein, partial [Micromonosporaceae bacterium]
MLTKVYVSATSQDLHEYRHAISEAARQLGLEDVVMESYVAGTQPPLERCLHDVDRCEIYVGLFAWRYGFVPPNEVLSITELEYQRAVEQGKRILIFLVHDKAPWPRHLIDGGEEAVQVERLRRELKEKHLVSFFTGLSDLQARAAVALARLMLAAMAPASTHRRDTAEDVAQRRSDLRAIARRLCRRFESVELDALTFRRAGADLTITLSSMYVEQYAADDSGSDAAHARNGIGDDEDASGHSAYRRRASTPLFDLITDAGRRKTVLLADTGGGKSATLRYIALSLSGDEPSPRLAALHDYLPLVIELHNYEKSGADSFLQYLDRQAAGAEDMLTAYLASGGKVLMMLDGLDGVFDLHRRAEMTNEIIAFADRKNVRVIVAARVGGYDRRALNDAGFAHVTLRDFDEEQITTFLDQWYVQALPGHRDEAAHLRARMLDAMHNSPSMRDLAGNPLLLTILAVIGRDQELPRQRWNVYEHAANVLVAHWEADQMLPSSDRDAVTAVKMKLLRRLALRMQTKSSGLNANYIERDQLADLFEDYLA